MKLDRKAPESASSFASVSVGTPVWPSSVRFGVYQTKSGGEALFRSGMSAEESLTVIGCVRKVRPGVVPHGIEARVVGRVGGQVLGVGGDAVARRGQLVGQRRHRRKAVLGRRPVVGDALIGA